MKHQNNNKNHPNEAGYAQWVFNDFFVLCSIQNERKKKSWQLCKQLYFYKKKKKHVWLAEFFCCTVERIRSPLAGDIREKKND